MLLLNQVAPFRRRIWTAVQRRLGISYAQIDLDITDWHIYELLWYPDGCRFNVDDKQLMQTPFSPRGPLGFVCWVDNQYMIVTARGRFGWGYLPIIKTQWMEVVDLLIEQQ